MTATTTWGLVVETTVGAAERKRTEAQVVGLVEGTREEALAELERRAREHVPAHPFNPKRRRLLRSHDGFLLIVDGAWSSFLTRFSVAELLQDSAAPAPQPPPEPAAEEPVAEEPPAPARPTPEQLAQRDEDGVPVVPGWLGRRDLM
ncbi:hypothetical protein HCJ93_15515 [Streptomyces sp. SBST2-5]|uniref:Uncharacterized protein n=1 Tax=Streptomyces composti TaxID=2720025 RepID=A0ABX1A8T3_9ACTN|nr:hypothetical protein [Streptomyces composti]NJP51437.1 hypothetical protein [Streptomyces composti]